MSTTLLSTISLDDFVSLVEQYWTEQPKMVPPAAYQLFIEEDLTSHTGDTKKYNEFDEETFAKLMREGQDSPLAAVTIGYNKTMQAKRVAMEVNITWNLRRYNKYPEVNRKLTDLSHFCPQRLELDLTHRLTFATDTSYTDMDGETVDTTVGDGLALVSASHTLAASAITFSNVITGNPVFSQGGLEIAELQANTNIYSHFGERRIKNFDVIWTSDDPTTCNDVKQVLKSTADVDAAQSGVENVYKGKYRHVILPWLATDANAAYVSTKRKRWGLCATGEWQAFYGIFENSNLKMPSAGNSGEDVHNDNWTFGARMSYGIVTTSPQGLLMSTGLGS